MSSLNCSYLPATGRKGGLEAWFLVGATASGKTEVAHWIAGKLGLEIISADSMQVYRGMDIGTAKPNAEMRAEIPYHGLDLVSPDQPFSLWDYVSYTRKTLLQIRRGAIITGGTGLYIKALIQGLDETSPPDPELRRELEGVLERDGVEGLRRRIASISPRALDMAADSSNPRRLIRAAERCARPKLAHEGGGERHETGVLAGLSFDGDDLNSRIESRIERMYDQGLIEEVEGLLSAYGRLSNTAMQAIGYAEALDVVSGSISRDEAMKKTAARTRRYAKRQRTWFRHQADVRWIRRSNGESVEAVGERVLRIWREHGPVAIA